MDPTIVMTMLATAVSALFGLLVAQQRSQVADLKDEGKKKDEKIEALEGRLAARDDVVAQNTATMVKIADSQAELIGMLKDVVSRVERMEDRA